MIIKIDTLRVVHASPKQLMKDIFDKIDNKEIITWVYDYNEKLSHKGGQYIDKFYFEYEIESIPTIIALHLYADLINSYAISKAIPLLEGMLKKHFGDEIEIL